MKHRYRGAWAASIAAALTIGPQVAQAGPPGPAGATYGSAPAGATSTSSPAGATYSSGGAGSATIAPPPSSGATIAPPIAPPTKPVPKASKRIRAWLRIGTTEYSGIRVSPDLPARIEGLGLQRLRDRGFVTSVSGEYVIDVVVAPLESGGYVTTLAVLKGDEEVAGTRVRRKCDFCLEDELLTQIKETIDGSAAAIEADAAPHEATPPPEPEPSRPPEPEPPPPLVGPPPPPQPTTTDDGSASERVHPRVGLPGRLGIAALFVGAAALGTGVGLLVVDERTGQDRKAVGFTLAGIGGVAMLTGVGLLVVDREARRHSVAPAASKSTVGIVWSGRF